MRGLKNNVKLEFPAKMAFDLEVMSKCAYTIIILARNCKIFYQKKY